MRLNHPHHFVVVVAWLVGRFVRFLYLGKVAVTLYRTEVFWGSCGVFDLGLSSSGHRRNLRHSFVFKDPEFSLEDAAAYRTYAILMPGLHNTVWLGKVMPV